VASVAIPPGYVMLPHGNNPGGQQVLLGFSIYQALRGALIVMERAL